MLPNSVPKLLKWLVFEELTATMTHLHTKAVACSRIDDIVSTIQLYRMQYSIIHVNTVEQVKPC